MRNDSELDGVTLLGDTRVKYPDQYTPEVLETFVNKHPGNDYLVTFTCPEFTSLCPKTGQPDFARILISYIPRERMVESKSLKLYLFQLPQSRRLSRRLREYNNERPHPPHGPEIYRGQRHLHTPRRHCHTPRFANWGDPDHQHIVAARMLANMPCDF